MPARGTWMAGPSPAMTKQTTARSSQPLRPRVRLLPAEAGAALQRVGLEPALHLDPAAIDAAGLEQDHDHQHEAVQRRLQSRHATDAKWQVVADDGDELRQQANEQRAEDDAVQRAQATDEHDGDELHR